ncbi:hypothetical protein PRUB_a3774 [Pseudoalteromonas rubra]|uniref:Uncharacterized protein n=1 Tax=Pseudoalteromonas rubra TaxID=43658 RepID=A0A8T0C8D6_9GAMM|nr:hypothetical protein [Pseudoalteromonas rubra]KAF7786949.1 hypothetical protein PRUB_a3774 [Pseudoalteromonas rubra]
MKLTLKKTSIKHLSTNARQIHQADTPQVAGGTWSPTVLYACATSLCYSRFVCS